MGCKTRVVHKHALPVLHRLGPVQQPLIKHLLPRVDEVKSVNGLCPVLCGGAPRVAASIMPGPPPDQVVQPSRAATCAPSWRARSQCGLAALSRALP